MSELWAIVLAACVLAAVLLVGRVVWRRNRIRRLAWPKARSVVQFSRFCVAYLEGQGWTVDAGVDALNARKGARMAKLHCRGGGQRLRPSMVQDVATIGHKTGMLQVLVVDAEPESAATEAAAAAGVAVLRPADLARLEEMIIEHRRRARAAANAKAGPARTGIQPGG